MILAVDVHYSKDDRASIVGITFRNWSDTAPVSVFKDNLQHVEPYVPGSFYKRELPCILKLIKQIDLSRIEVIVVDGYVYLADDGRLGLGSYLYYELKEKIPVIGVAKSYFHWDDKLVTKVYRGKSHRPLYITAVGLDRNSAASAIQSMAGEYRIPTLLKLLDQETRKICI